MSVCWSIGCSVACSVSIVRSLSLISMHPSEHHLFVYNFQLVVIVCIYFVLCLSIIVVFSPLSLHLCDVQNILKINPAFKSGASQLPPSSFSVRFFFFIKSSIERIYRSLKPCLVQHIMSMFFAITHLQKPIYICFANAC